MDGALSVAEPLLSFLSRLSKDGGREHIEGKRVVSRRWMVEMDDGRWTMDDSKRIVCM